MAKTLFLLAILFLATAVFGWAVIKFYYFIQRESNIERVDNLKARIDANDSIEELKATARWFKRKGK